MNKIYERYNQLVEEDLSGAFGVEDDDYTLLVWGYAKDTARIRRSAKNLQKIAQGLLEIADEVDALRKTKSRREWNAYLSDLGVEV